MGGHRIEWPTPLSTTFINSVISMDVRQAVLVPSFLFVSLTFPVSCGWTRWVRVCRDNDGEL